MTVTRNWTEGKMLTLIKNSKVLILKFIFYKIKALLFLIKRHTIYLMLVLVLVFI